MKHYFVFSGMNKSQNMVLRSKYNVLSRVFQNGNDISCHLVMTRATVKKLLKDNSYYCSVYEHKVGRKIVYRSISICRFKGDAKYCEEGL